MLIAFELSMPSNNSWNGRWSGEGKCYAHVLSIPTSKKARAKWDAVIADSPYGHSFGDGWYASVAVREVDRAEAMSLRKRSKGFCGYDWMISNIRWHGSASDPAPRSVAAGPALESNEGMA